MKVKNNTTKTIKIMRRGINNQIQGMGNSTYKN